MADATWPAELDTYLSVRGFRESQATNNVITQEMASGPPKQRKRTTTGPIPIDATMLMSYDHVEILDSFFKTTLFEGVLTFDGLPHPRTRDTDTTWQFRGEGSLSWAPEGSVMWRVSFKLQILP